MAIRIFNDLTLRFEVLYIKYVYIKYVYVIFFEDLSPPFGSMI